MTDEELSKCLEVEAERDVARLEIERLRAALGEIREKAATMRNGRAWTAWVAHAHLNACIADEQGTCPATEHLGDTVTGWQAFP
jgi:hypothetical protein